MKKKQLIWIGVATCASILIAIILSFVLNVLFKVHSDGIFSAEWEAGDALNYAASIFGAVGTIVLGYVAYKQNDKLQKMEDNNYIANFSSTIILKSIYSELVKKKPTRIDPNEHCEQIIKEKNLQENKPYVDYKFTCKAKIIGDVIPAFIHIKKCDISYSDETEKSMDGCIYGMNLLNNYSRLAIYDQKYVMFEITYLINYEKRDEFEKLFEHDSCIVIVEIEFDVISIKNVLTKYKSRIYCKGKKDCNKIIWSDNNPQLFFYGHNIVSINELKIAGDKENHGKIKNANRKHSR